MGQWCNWQNPTQIKQELACRPSYLHLNLVRILFIAVRVHIEGNVEALRTALCQPTLPNTGVGPMTHWPTGISNTATYVTLFVERCAMFHETKIQQSNQKQNQMRAGVLSGIAEPSKKADSSRVRDIAPLAAAVVNIPTFLSGTCP